MNMSLDEIINECAAQCGIGTYLYAEIDKANYLFDDVTDYPVVLRLFQGNIYEADSGLQGFIKRDLTLYFYDSLGEVEADIETQISPMAERMLSKALEFIAALRGMGVDTMVQNIRPTGASMTDFDALLVGVQCNLTITYKACDYGRRNCYD